MFGFAPVFSIHSFSSSILSYACQSFFFFFLSLPTPFGLLLPFWYLTLFLSSQPFFKSLNQTSYSFLSSFFFFFLWLYFQPSTPFFDLQSFFQSYFFLILFFCVQLLSVLFCCSFLTFHSSFSLHFFSDCFSSTFQWDSPLSSLLSCHFLSHHCKYPVFAIPM